MSQADITDYYLNMHLRSLLRQGDGVQAVDLPIPGHVPEDAKRSPGPSVSTVEIRTSFSRFDCGPGGLRPGFCRNLRSVPFPFPLVTSQTFIRAENYLILGGV